MKQILKALVRNIENENFGEIDSILESIHTSGKYSEEQIEGYYDLLQEATLFAEFKEKEYKEEFMKIYNK